MFHLFNHAIFKSLLFVNAAAVEQQTGTTRHGRAGRPGARMPFTGTTSVVALLSTAGVPPLSGFWSKLMIIVALWQAGYHVYAILAVLASVVTLAYFLSMQRRVFFGKLRARACETCARRALGAGAAVGVVLAGDHRRRRACCSRGMSRTRSCCRCKVLR